MGMDVTLRRDANGWWGRLSAPSGATIVDLGPLELTVLIDDLVTAGARAGDVSDAVYQADANEWSRIYDPDGNYAHLLADHDAAGQPVSFPRWLLWWRLSPDEIRNATRAQKMVSNALLFGGIGFLILIVVWFALAGCHSDPGCPTLP